MIYDYTLTTGKGEELKLSEYKGKVILVVNTATVCGFTPQYAPIEQLYKDYHDQGLEILDIPCNQFGGQAPGSFDDIHDFCTSRYGITFPQFAKINVNGASASPLYVWLKSKKPGDIQWNFTKFLIDRKGRVVARFEPMVTPQDIAASIEEQL